MKYTTNYNLKKPDYTDLADVEDFNENMDTIDSELKSGGDHASSTINPHGVTKSQVGLGNVDNVKQAPYSHISDNSNPHSVTASQVGVVPTRISNGVLEYYDAGLWKEVGGGSPIKSIQRGIATLTNDHNVTISSINTSKAFIIATGYGYSTSTSDIGGVNSSSVIGSESLRARITSSTNINLTISSNTMATIYCAWEVVEFV